MTGVPHARPMRLDPVALQQEIREGARTSFTWSRAKIRIVGLVLLAAAAPAAVAFSLPTPFVRWLSLLWLIAVALLMHALSRRAGTETEVLSIDARGILDRRLMARPIAWQEIAAICPVDVERSHVVDLRLRWPKATLAGTRWPIRIGAYCQIAYDVPAVSISTLLLEGNVGAILDAVAQHRPDLLDRANRKAPLPERP